MSAPVDKPPSPKVKKPKRPAYTPPEGPLGVRTARKWIDKLTNIDVKIQRSKAKSKSTPQELDQAKVTEENPDPQWYPLHQARLYQLKPKRQKKTLKSGKTKTWVKHVRIPLRAPNGEKRFDEKKLHSLKITDGPRKPDGTRDTVYKAIETFTAFKLHLKPTNTGYVVDEDAVTPEFGYFKGLTPKQAAEHCAHRHFNTIGIFPEEGLSDGTGIFVLRRVTQDGRTNSLHPFKISKIEDFSQDQPLESDKYRLYYTAPPYQPPTIKPGKPETYIKYDPKDPNIQKKIRRIHVRGRLPVTRLKDGTVKERLFLKTVIDFQSQKPVQIPLTQLREIVVEPISLSSLPMSLPALRFAAQLAKAKSNQSHSKKGDEYKPRPMTVPKMLKKPIHHELWDRKTKLEQLQFSTKTRKFQKELKTKRDRRANLYYSLAEQILETHDQERNRNSKRKIKRVERGQKKMDKQRALWRKKKGSRPVAARQEEKVSPPKPVASFLPPVALNQAESPFRKQSPGQDRFPSPPAGPASRSASQSKTASPPKSQPKPAASAAAASSLKRKNSEKNVAASAPLSQSKPPGSALRPGSERKRRAPAHLKDYV